MAKGLKSLAKDTAIYGVSSIVGKFLNWLLVPLYTYKLVETADYGVVTNLYAWTAILLVVLTYGMETGFFRFANKYKDSADKVYGNGLISVGFTSLLFAVLVVFLKKPIANGLGYGQYPEYIWMLGLSVALDAVSAIPFAYLRFRNRPIAFAGLKFVYIVLNISLNLFFLIICPWLMDVAPDTISWFYNPDYGVGYIFVSNIISTSLQTLVLSKYMFEAKFEFDSALLRKMLKYSYPLLFLGILGSANQILDKILFPFLALDGSAKSELGVYGAAGKIAMVIMMFTQAFRFAYEPFVFAKTKSKESLESYAMAMKFFVIFSLLIFLGVVFYMDILKFIIKDTYWSGLMVVPIIMMSYIFQGVYFNLSIWYKLTDRNYYGALFSAVGTIIILLGNIFFVSKYSYWASAWSAFVGYFTVMIISYFFGQKYMPVNYNLKSIGFYGIVSILLFVVSMFIRTDYLGLNIALKTLLLFVFVAIVVKRDFPLSEIPYINRFLKKR